MRSPWRAGSERRGTTLIEVLTALAIGSIITSSLYLLVGSTIKARLIVGARVSDQERGRLAIGWLADRLRQVNFDAAAACPDGFVRLGSGRGFAGRMAFRAVIDHHLTPPRRTYVFYLDQGTLWQETLTQEAPEQCGDEAERRVPSSARVVVAPPTVQDFRLRYLDANGLGVADPARVRLVGISLTVLATGASGR
ncbi:MAG TPA: prepilin-type N-terminal cleavage/methylation domain-containing protein, partial [bacterium]|nr:prepilin-type N-terminal cleavage/methylation domain-containing protein [bacterium]